MKVTIPQSILAAGAAVLGASLSLSQAHAGVIVQCGGAPICSVGFSIDMNANIGIGNGELLYNSTTGDIALNLEASSTNATSINSQMGTLMWNVGGNTVSVSSLSGNADPILGFGVGASTGAMGATFGFNFDLPVAIEGPILATSSMNYSLTATTSAGAQITAPVSGNVLSANEFDSSVGGLGFLNKGVDIGETYFVTGIGSGGQTFNASNSFVGSLDYDLMSLEIDFGLSPNSIVGITGVVTQTVVPVPAAAWLFASALLGMVGIKRKH